MNRRSPAEMAARLVVVAAACAGAASGWLTWTVSGSATRNSYASLRAAQRLGIEQLTPFRVVWFCVPVAVAAIVFLVIGGSARAAAAIGLATGLVLLLFGAGVLMTPVADGVGPWLSLGAGLVLAAGSIAVLAQARRRV